MQIMKRLRYALVAGYLALLGSVALPGTSLASALSQQTGITAPDCVEISLPIVPGMQTCKADDGGIGVPNDAATGGAIIVYLRYVLQLLSSAVAAVVLLMIIIAGVQYITSGANPSQVKAAKDRLTNALIALVLFLCMFAILNYLVPGGVL